MRARLVVVHGEPAGDRYRAVREHADGALQPLFAAPALDLAALFAA